MRNPLRSEEEAFRFVLLTIGYFALIVIGAIINTWVGLAVFVVLTLVVAYVAFIRPRNEPPPRVAPTLPHPDDERRILVIANETVGGDTLCDLVVEKARDGNANVLIVAPALNTPLRHLATDDVAARADAQARLDASLARAGARGGGTAALRGADHARRRRPRGRARGSPRVGSNRRS